MGFAAGGGGGGGGGGDKGVELNCVGGAETLESSEVVVD